MIRRIAMTFALTGVLYVHADAGVMIVATEVPGGVSIVGQGSLNLAELTPDIRGFAPPNILPQGASGISQVNRSHRSV